MKLQGNLGYRWSLSLFFFFTCFSLLAQLRLNVAGDAKISGALALGSGADENLFIGINSGGKNTSGVLNTFVGSGAGRDNTTGFYNTFMGKWAGLKNTEGTENSFFGLDAGVNNTIGNYNTSVGTFSGHENTSGSFNTFLGRSAGYNTTTGSFNTFVGQEAGVNNTTGTRNTFIGVGAFQLTPGDSLDQAMAIGFNARVDCHNCAAIGGTGASAVKVGIGTPSPEEVLHVKGSIRADNGEFQSWGSIVLHPDVDESGDDVVQFVNSVGDENMRIDEVGRLGIGTNSPAELLSIENANKAAFRFTRGAAFGALEQNSAGGALKLAGLDNVAVIQLRTYGDSYFNGGKIGFGTATPGSELHIKQTGVTANNGIRLEPSTSTNYWNAAVVGNDFRFYYNGVEKGFVDNGTAGFVTSSDRRLKRDIARFDDVLERVMQLQPSSYYYKDVIDPERRAWGFIAQEVEKIFPEIIYQGDSYKALAYDDFAILSIKAIQEQQELIKDLQEQAEEAQELKAQVRDQQRQIDELRALVEDLAAGRPDETQGNYVLPLEQQAELGQNQPNPFHQNTLVKYFIPANVQDARLQVNTADGKVLGTVSINEKGAGQLTIKAGTYPAGTYFYSLVLDGKVIETKRMVLTH
jgi:hypothetical protein